MATVVLADDHALVRAGLRRILENSGNVVVGEAGDGLQVVPIVEKMRPEVLQKACGYRCGALASLQDQGQGRPGGHVVGGRS